MAYRAFRPNSANMCQLRKQRAHKGNNDIERTLNFNPWASSYKENFCQTMKEENKVLFVEPKAITEPIFTKAVLQPAKQTQEIVVRKNRPKTSYRPNGHPQTEASFLNKAISGGKEMKTIEGNDRIQRTEMTPKMITDRPVSALERQTGKSDSQSIKSSLKDVLIKQNNYMQPAVVQGPVVSVVKASDNVHNSSNMFAERPMSKHSTKRPSTAKSTAPSPPTFPVQTAKDINSTMRTPEDLNLQLPDLKPINETTPFQNIIGQPEEWLDVRDKVSPPVHSRLVNYIPSNFLAANVKVLANAPNEYYPYLTGVCLCKQCICGNCRCVHFKYKLGGNVFSQLVPGIDDFATEYKAEFKPKKMPLNNKQRQPNELTLVPFKNNYDTSNSLAFKPANGADAYNSHPFMLRAKINNLGPTVCYVRQPIDGLTCYKRDYPNWGAAVPNQMTPFVPRTFNKGMPFMGKPVNQEYGAYFKNGDRPEPVTACMPPHRNNVLAKFDPEFPNETDYQRNFKPKDLGDDPLQKFKPTDNLELEVN